MAPSSIPTPQQGDPQQGDPQQGDPQQGDPATVEEDEMTAPKLRLVDKGNVGGRAGEAVSSGAVSSGAVSSGAVSSGAVPQSNPPSQRKRSARGSSSPNAKAKKRAAQARDVMRTPVVCCREADSLNTAAQLMWEHDLGVLVVVDEHQTPVSIITDRDICMAAYTQGVALWGSSVASAMARRVVTCGEETPVSQLRERMMELQLRRIPVTDANGRVAGIVGLTDLLDESQAELPKARKRGSSGPELLKVFAGIHSEPKIARG